MLKHAFKQASLSHRPQTCASLTGLLPLTNFSLVWAHSKTLNVTDERCYTSTICTLNRYMPNALTATLFRNIVMEAIAMVCSHSYIVNEIATPILPTTRSNYDLFIKCPSISQRHVQLQVTWTLT
jgi:hypothetical protein